MAEGKSNNEVDERARRVDLVRTIAESAHIELPAGSPRHEPLSDRAALLIALGHLDETTRTTALARIRAGRKFPALAIRRPAPPVRRPASGLPGGFGGLRLITEELRWLDRRLEGLRTGPTRLALLQRRALQERRLGSYRTRFVMSSAHYASGVRAIRRDRRDGIHLDVDQRTALFDALCLTPTPLGVGPGPISRAREILGSTVADQLDSRGVRAAEVVRSLAGADMDRFADRYDTLLFLAGMYHDRIVGAPIWHSDLFAVARAQLDPGTEVVQIAVDVVALAQLDRELTDAFEAQGDGVDEEGRREVLVRRADLIPVWDQVIDRVAALSRVVDEISVAQVEHRSFDAVQRTVGLDDRIDQLIARSGTRELSADNTHSVSEQISRDGL